MLGIRYYKSDLSTHVIRTAKGQIHAAGRGLSFFYNSATTSIATVPLNAQEAPFIFNLQTGDFQEVTVQGQLTYQVAEPMITADIFNFTIHNGTHEYLTDDPMNLSDRVIRAVQALIEAQVQAMTLRETLPQGQSLIRVVRDGLAANNVLQQLGLRLLDVAITRLVPTPETARALEATTREAILQEADDATYSRRKSAVEQERVIKETELQTELSVQQKEQEIATQRLENEREILQGQTETEQQRLHANIERETERKALVVLRADNSNQEADAEAYAITAKMQAIQALPVEHLKAMALAQMQPDQLMAMAVESLAQNATNIGELNLGPELFGQSLRKAVRENGNRGGK